METIKSYLVIRRGNLACMPHINSELEIIFVQKGFMTIKYDDAEIKIGERQAAIVLPYRLHGFSPSENTQAMVFMFSYQIAEQFYLNYKVADMEGYSFDISNELNNYIMSAACDLDRDMNDFAVKGLFYPLICEYLKKNKAVENRKPESVSFRKITDFIAERFREQITMDDVAEATGIGKQTIRSMFARHMGMSFSEFINFVRVQKAYTLICTIDASVSEIAYYCGFGSIRNFNRVFNNIFGFSPSRLRKDQKCS